MLFTKCTSLCTMEIKFVDKRSFDKNWTRGWAFNRPYLFLIYALRDRLISPKSAKNAITQKCSIETTVHYLKQKLIQHSQTEHSMTAFQTTNLPSKWQKTDCIETGNEAYERYRSWEVRKRLKNHTTSSFIIFTWLSNIVQLSTIELRLQLELWNVKYIYIYKACLKKTNSEGFWNRREKLATQVRKIERPYQDEKNCTIIS